jgi:hypothetical protein
MRATIFSEGSGRWLSRSSPDPISQRRRATFANRLPCDGLTQELMRVASCGPALEGRLGDVGAA